MRIYGNAGQALTCENEPTFEGFATKSGRDVLSDVARAHDQDQIKSPIKLAPLPADAERALVARHTKKQLPRARREPKAPRVPRTPPSPRPTPARRAPQSPRTPRPASTRRTAEQTRALVVELHGQGLTTRQIGDRIGIGTARVRVHLSDAGLAPILKGRRAFDAKAIVTCYAAGHEIGATADMFGCSIMTVYNALNLYHVVRRDTPARASRRTRPPRTPRPTGPRQDVIEAYQQGITNAAAIARHLGISWATVRHSLTLAGLEPTPAPRGPQPGTRQRVSRRPDLVESVIVEEYAAGKTVPELAVIHSTGRATIRRILLRAGVELRDDRKTKSGSKPKIYDASLVTTVGRLYSIGMSQLEVAIYCKTTQKVVQRLMERHGIEARPAVARPERAGNHAAMHRDHVEALGGSALIREWAARNDIPCPRVGLPPTRVVDAFIDAHEQASA